MVAIARLEGKKQLISLCTDYTNSGYEKLLIGTFVDLSRLYKIEDQKFPKLSFSQTRKISRQHIFTVKPLQNSKTLNQDISNLSI